MTRIGTGYDVHRLEEGLPLWMGGVFIPHSHGLLGHSDADVLLHAICDALLGAAALGDIGKHFPDSDPKYKDADSTKLLWDVVGMLKEAGYKVVNIDCTVCAQEPKLAPFIDEMRENIAVACGIRKSAVSVKATTEEGLGFTGKLEGVSATAVCLLQEL